MTLKSSRNSSHSTGLFGELITVLYIGLISWIARATHIEYILFPELGALSHDIFKRPRGTWANAPGMLILTPFLSGVAGMLISRCLHFGVIPILLATAAAMLIIRLLQSPIAPAISAGVLPISLGITSWFYPLSLLVGLVSLVAISAAWRRIVLPRPSMRASDIADDITEEAPRDYSWLPFFSIFLLGTASLAELTGWHLILFPPLIVIAFEMFAHSDVCPWAGRPFMLPVACALSASAGVGLVLFFGNTPLAAIASTVIAIVILRAFDLHVPPALAVGLLPFVIHPVNYTFPVSVGIGTLSLTMLFLAWRALRKKGWTLP